MSYELASLNWMAQCARNERSVAIHAIPQDHPFSGFCIGCFDLNAKSRSYQLSSITGFDRRAIDCVIRQPRLFTILRDAMAAIEGNRLTTIGFRCHGGTHRSVAVAYLLLLLVYPKGALHVHSWRTVTDASQCLERQPAVYEPPREQPGA